MKKVYLLLMIVMVAFSCEDIETPNLGVDNQWIQFERATQSGSEADASILVPILYAANSNASGIDVSFTYTASTNDGYTIEPANGIVNIPAGEFVGYIEITPVNDIIAGEDIVIDFSIEGNSSFALGIAGQGVYNATSIVTILEDDCPIPINDWVGTYSVNEAFTSGVNAPNGLGDFFAESYQLELSLAPGDITGTKVEINNTPGFNVYINDGTIMSFLTCNNEVSFDAGFPQLALFEVYEYSSSSYNETAFSITCSGPYATYGPYEFTITKI